MQSKSLGWEPARLVKCLPGMCLALGSVSGTAKQEEGGGQEEEEEIEEVEE